MYGTVIIVLALLLTQTVKCTPIESFNLRASTTTSRLAPVSPSASTASPNSTTNPCLQIQLLQANGTAIYTAQSSSATSSYYINFPAKLAWDCLNDVPLDLEAGKIWLDSLKPYIEWQSTTAYLKDPPQGYQEPPSDIWGNLDQLYTDLSTGKFKNEYEFEFELYRLFQETHDGHFRYIPTMIGGIFGWGRPISLVSYSVDGIELPRPFVYEDVLSSFVNGTVRPSAVTEIDGMEAEEFLEQWSQFGSLQDPDALYNNNFHSLAQTILGSSGTGPGMFAGGGRGQYTYPGPTTTLKFENGTVKTFDNYARLTRGFASISNGSDLYKYLINPLYHQNGPKTASVQARNLTHSAIPRPGYPDFVLIDPYNYIGGYYLTETGYQDVAVLSVASFLGTDEYQDVVYQFLEKASSEGKTKLVIDVSANAGGTILQGYNMFLNLFPDILPYGATRFRSHEAFDVIGETISERIFEYPYDYYGPPNILWQDFEGGTPFNYRADVDENYEPFKSWRQKNPPNQFYRDNFTSIIRWNLSDPSIVPANGVELNTIGNRTNMPPSRPFEAENIVMLYDGYCASTCALFSEMMTQQVGVKTVSIGGRPSRKPMQTVGGVKGANNYPWGFINEIARITYLLAEDQTGFFNSTSIFAYIDPTTADIPFSRGTVGGGQVNVRDAIRKGDNSQTPLQFIYDEADCRLFYTAEMTVDVTAMWEKVVDVTWKGDSCVTGGLDKKAKRSSATTEKAKRKAAYRHAKRMQTVNSAKIEALRQSLNVFTDVSSIIPQRGLMLP